MKKIIDKAIRRYLNTKGLQLSQRRHDLDSFFITEKYKQRVIDDTSDAVRSYLEKSHIFPISEGFDARDAVAQFFALYHDSPAKTMAGGCGFNNLLWLYTIANSFNPQAIVESGSYQGGSAWVFRRATPTAEMHCFDLDFSRLLIHDQTINFHEHDWSTYKFKDIDLERTICFFDDHADQVMRLIEAHERGFKYLIFDDNTPVNFLYLARGGVATVDFLFDDRLVDGELIEWSMLGHRHSYTPDQALFKKARSLIKAHTKVPSLNTANGFVYQTPLTLIVLG